MQHSYINVKIVKHYTPLLLQLSAQTGAETVFLVPVDHTESDNLHIQVAE